jgi:hypothetical protein
MPKSIDKKTAVGVAVLALLIFGWALYQQQQKKPTVVDMRGQLDKDHSVQLATRELSQIRALAILHTAGGPMSLQYYTQLHISKGFGAIAYGEIIFPDGVVYVLHDPTTVSNHNTNKTHNTNTYGICLVGNFEKTEPTAAQLKALHGRINYWRKRLPNQVEVRGHREFKATSCPGENLTKHLQAYQLRA